MSFIPNTEKDRQLMLEKIGINSVDQLFKDVPAGKRYPEIKWMTK